MRGKTKTYYIDGAAFQGLRMVAEYIGCSLSYLETVCARATGDSFTVKGRTVSTTATTRGETAPRISSGRLLGRGACTHRLGVWV